MISIKNFKPAEVNLTKHNVYGGDSQRSCTSGTCDDDTQITTTYDDDHGCYSGSSTTTVE